MCMKTSSFFCSFRPFLSIINFPVWNCRAFNFFCYPETKTKKSPFVLFRSLTKWNTQKKKYFFPEASSIAYKWTQNNCGFDLMLEHQTILRWNFPLSEKKQQNIFASASSVFLLFTGPFYGKFFLSNTSIFMLSHTRNKRT